MPEQLSPHRLSREELELLQRKVLREWLTSDHLAARDPRAWQQLADRDDRLVSVEIGGATEPGYIALVPHGHGPIQHSDLDWSLTGELPFEDESVDLFTVSLSPEERATDFLAREIVRALKTAGQVAVQGTRLRSALLALGLSPDEETMRLVKTKDVSYESGPLREKEVVLGTLKLPEVRRLTSRVTGGHNTDE